MSRWPKSGYAINNAPPSSGNTPGGCPYGTVPPDYDFYYFSGTRQLGRRFPECRLTFAAKGDYADNETLLFNAERYGESCYGDLVGTAGARVHRYRFAFDTAGDGVPVGYRQLDISGATTAADVAAIFAASFNALSDPILECIDMLDGNVRLIGKRPLHQANSFSGSGYGVGKTTMQWVRTLNVGCPPLASLGGRGAIMAPRDRQDGIGWQHEGELLFGNFQIT